MGTLPALKIGLGISFRLTIVKYKTNSTPIKFITFAAHTHTHAHRETAYKTERRFWLIETLLIKALKLTALSFLSTNGTPHHLT